MSGERFFYSGQALSFSQPRELLKCLIDFVAGFEGECGK